jgi:hypothetical protein
MRPPGGLETVSKITGLALSANQPWRGHLDVTPRAN